jgi:hypothetical protein
VQYGTPLHSQNLDYESLRLRQIAQHALEALLVGVVNASINPATNPIQMYHLGLWFNSPPLCEEDRVKILSGSAKRLLRM